MTQDRLTVLSQLPEALAKPLEEIVINPKFSATITAQQVEHLMDATGFNAVTLAQHLLPLAAIYADTPVSNFHVGAIVRGGSGALYFGANIEFSGVPLGQTIHAEQAAIAHAWMCGENKLSDIIVDTPPCGHCRQFMNELADAEALQITLPNQATKKLHDYLPEAFGPADLGMKIRLMDQQTHQIQADYSDPLQQAALKALNHSYAPYSHSLSGIAIELKDQHIYLGSYAENAAFNPSLPPLQVAVILLRMGGYSLNDINRVVLAETQKATVTHLDTTRSVLQKIAPHIQLEHIEI
ncbi:cytidine deaminase [Vibrio gazogenes]|uniref:Cytidine deaminase n=1 Tax=Vibrio gazogenes DSM 21264 = NBRC 103151 TaxID=1123492 RepID=A0A1M5ALV9_VIBGA|nr:cytidine deaminase [Vibrio gazogenes]USP12634.1 cytidine deaminase [Vibrio gazogenes]SHF31097.1 cytidine deaminase [Vibrio gazogenes DSM 21264] [Vibrio gazogenes DSM 21264 = NBRC 103151]SJN55783.1 Cytidine deaminase [Vibrio gazogenes]